MEPEAIVVDILQRGKEQEQEQWTREKVKNAIKDHLVIDREHVRTLGQSPADWVQHPDDHKVDSAEAVQSLVRVNQARPQSAEYDGETMYALVLQQNRGLPANDLQNIQERQNAESKEAPLVRCRRESTDESTHDRDDNHEYREEEIGQRKARYKEQREEDKRRVDEPLNISHPLHSLISIQENMSETVTRTKMLRVGPLLNSVRTTVCPRFDAIAKYVMVDTVRTATAI